MVKSSFLWNASRNFLSLVFWLAASATDIASLAVRLGTWNSKICCFVELCSCPLDTRYDDMIALISLIYYWDLRISWIPLGWRARENSQLGQLSTNLRFTLQLSSNTKCLRGVGCCSPVQPLCQLETSARIVFFMHFIIFLTHMPAILVPRQTPNAQRKLWRTQAPAYRLALTGHSLAPMQKSK